MVERIAGPFSPGKFLIYFPYKTTSSRTFISGVTWSWVVFSPIQGERGCDFRGTCTPPSERLRHRHPMSVASRDSRPPGASHGFVGSGPLVWHPDPTRPGRSRSSPVFTCHRSSLSLSSAGERKGPDVQRRPWSALRAALSAAMLSYRSLASDWTCF